MTTQRDGQGPHGSAGPAGQWQQLCADFMATWAQVIQQASTAPPGRAAAIYAAGAQRLAVLVARVPVTAASPGGWLDVALRACAAGAPPQAADAVAGLARALAHCQSALITFADVERRVLVSGCAAFGARVAALGTRETDLRAHLRLWIAAIDEAHAAAARDPHYVRDHAAVINAMLEVTIAVRAAGEEYVRALGLPVRAELQQLESRIVELERNLAAAIAVAAPPATGVARRKAPRGAAVTGKAKPAPKVQNRPAVRAKPGAAKTRRTAKARR